MSTEARPEAKIIGYCRACGKALEEATVRHAQGTIYCEEHVPEQTAYSAPPPGSSYRSAPPPPAGVSPSLAAVLGLIPGVGAIYNGQYVKGFVHLFILGMLFIISDSPAWAELQPLIVLSIMGFWLYMPFEAYHTARRRQAGLPVDEFSGIVPSRPGTPLPLAPVLLIVFGSLILLENLNLLDIRAVLRYWPALMIALGLYLLIARRPPRTPGGSPSGSQGGGQ